MFVQKVVYRRYQVLFYLRQIKPVLNLNTAKSENTMTNNFAINWTLPIYKYVQSTFFHKISVCFHFFYEVVA